MVNQYIRRAKYYETDQMAIIHHSNYIRWFEEARIDFLEQIGFSYEKMEALGVMSPVLSVECVYKHYVKFNQTVSIEINMPKFNGVKMIVEYVVRNVDTNEVCVIGRTEHGFIDKNFKVISLKKSYPEMYDTIVKYLDETKTLFPKNKR